MPNPGILLEDGAQGPYEAVPKVLGEEEPARKLITTLSEYKREAVEGRQSGPNPRDAKWAQNLDLYWNRYDFSDKAPWQAKEVMPEVPSYVDRFAAALKEALVATPNGFYTVIDPADTERDLSDAVKRMMDVWLNKCGRNDTGTPASFPVFFEEQMKLGALMACSAVCTWKEDTRGGRIAFDTVDPREVWLDPTGRNLYRIRQITLDRHELFRMAKAVDGKGNPIYNLDEVSRMVEGMTMRDLQEEKARLAGHGTDTRSNRKTITLNEYIATVVGDDGEFLADRSLCVVAEDQYLIRGPEKIPFWHGEDFLLYSPLITVPLSVYGRSYMEDFGDVAKTFTHLTNLLLDAVRVTALNVFAVVPEMLTNPAQITSGVAPGKVFLLEQGFRAEDFAKALDLGSLDQGALQLWTSLKSELTEAAGVNEIGLGQFAPNSRTSATEISATQQSSSAIVRSVAQTIETRFIDPLLNIGWKTGVQHMSEADRMLMRAAGDEMFPVLMGRKRELAGDLFSFEARGISGLIQKAQMLQNLLSLLQVVAMDQNLTAAFMQKVDIQRLLNLLFDLSNVDASKLQASPREALVGQLMQTMTQGQEGAEAQETPGAQEVGSALQGMGIARD